MADGERRNLLDIACEAEATKYCAVRVQGAEMNELRRSRESSTDRCHVDGENEVHGGGAPG